MWHYWDASSHSTWADSVYSMVPLHVAHQACAVCYIYTIIVSTVAGEAVSKKGLAKGSACVAMVKVLQGLEHSCIMCKASVMSWAPYLAASNVKECSAWWQAGLLTSCIGDKQELWTRDIVILKSLPPDICWLNGELFSVSNGCRVGLVR